MVVGLSQYTDLDKARIEAKNQQRIVAIEQWKFIEPHIAIKFFKKVGLICGDPALDIPVIKKLGGIKMLL